MSMEVLFDNLIIFEITTPHHQNKSCTHRKLSSHFELWRTPAICLKFCLFLCYECFCCLPKVYPSKSETKNQTPTRPSTCSHLGTFNCSAINTRLLQDLNTITLTRELRLVFITNTDHVSLT